MKIEEYVDARRRNRRATEVVKESAQDKKLLEEEAATSVLKSASHSWDEELFGDIVGAEMRRQETAAAAVPKRRRLSGGGAAQTSEVEEVVSDLAVTRLRGYEDIRSLYDKTLAGFEQTKGKIGAEVPRRDLCNAVGVLIVRGFGFTWFCYEKLRPTCKVENIKDGKGLIAEYKQVAQERLELCVLLLSELKCGETSEARKAAIDKPDKLLSHWPSTPFPSLELVMPKHQVRGVVDNLKQCASAETLASEMERARGGINCWSLMQSSAKTGLQEVQKAVTDTARREKKREKDAENEQKKADAKRKKEEEKKAAAAALPQIGESQAQGVQGNPFWKSLFDQEYTPIHTVLADDPTQLSDDSFAAKTQLFLEQFPGSTPARTTGRTYLRIGQQAASLDAYYQQIVSCSKPLTPRKDCARMFQTQLVGVAAGQMTFAMVDAPVLRHGLHNDVSMAILPMDEFIRVMKGLNTEGDMAKLSARAMQMNTDLLEALGGSKKFYKVTLAAHDLVYVPPMSAVWERTVAPAAFIQFKWIPSTTDDWGDMAKQTISLQGWSSSEVLKKQRASLQRIMEHWSESQSKKPIVVDPAKEETSETKPCSLLAPGRFCSCVGYRLAFGCK